MPVSPGVGGRESVADGRGAAGVVRGSAAGVGAGAVRGAAGAGAGVGAGLLDSTAADLRAILRAAFLAGGASLMTGAAVATTAGAAALRVDFFGAAGVGGAGGGVWWGDGLGVLSQSLGGTIASWGPFRLNHADTNICSTLTK